MGNRKAPRSTNPLLVASAAITRAIDPANPSRITVIRLLGDALHTLQESQLTVDAIKSRTATHASRRNAPALTRLQLEADARVRAAHEHGARALFSATVAALLKLPSRAGPLRRRAVDILHVAGLAAGPAVAMQAADRVRSHINTLKKLSWSESDAADFDVVCAVLTLAEVSNCKIAGRELARDSSIFLLSQRVRQKCKRPELAYAIAVIVQSFPPHAPPDDRLVDAILELCISSSAIKPGAAGFGTALLTAVVVPLLVSRGPHPPDDAAFLCAKALRNSPTTTERAMWALALARASVTARRSATYQLRKYGTSDLASKFPRAPPSAAPGRFTTNREESSAAVWVSNEIFEESLLQVASSTGLTSGRIDSCIAVAAVLRMWTQALPDTIPIIIPRALAKLLPLLSSVAAVSTLVDAIWLGVLKHLKPSASSSVSENLLPALDESGLSLAAALHVCANLLEKHGRQAIRETGLTLDYNIITTTLIKKAHEACESTSASVRFGAVRLMSALVDALPRTCSQFLTAVLQNLRIADLNLATKQLTPEEVPNSNMTNSVNLIDQELSSILGNAAALSVLVHKVTSGGCSVPSALVRQCSIDSIAFLRLHHAREDGNALGPLATYIRRRVGWGLVAALAQGKMRKQFEGVALQELLALWKEELGYTHNRSSKDTSANASSLLSFSASSCITDMTEELVAADFDEILASSSTRAAALFALVCSLRSVSSPLLEQHARALVGSAAARITSLLASLGISAVQGSSVTGNGSISFGTTNIPWSDSPKKRSAIQLLKYLLLESSYMVQCAKMVPPRGDPAELCYLVSLALSEEAQKVLGEADAGDTVNSALTQGSSSSDKTPLFESGLANHRFSLHNMSSRASTWTTAHNMKQRKSERGRSFEKRADTSNMHSGGAWLFGKHGIDTLNAERVLIDTAQAIAVLVADDLATSGTLIELLSNAKLCPPVCAVISLEMAKRLSHSDLAEINRALAVLQVLTRRALGLPGGCHRSISSQNKYGRLYTPSAYGDSDSFRIEDTPGAALQDVAQSGGWLSWARSFSDEGHVARVPFHNFHTRALGTMYATRTVAAEAYRELSITGGAALWIGLMRKVISAVRDNVGGSSASQSVILSNAVSTLGALLDVVPDAHSGLRARPDDNVEKGKGIGSVSLDEISEGAVDIIAEAIEMGKTDVQAAAAVALSSCSHKVASSSERLLAALLRAWAQDKGEFASLGHLGKCASEADLWTFCFSNIWMDMGVRATSRKARFFRQDSYGIGSASSSFVTGAAAVLSSCRLHWWPLSESSYSSIKELSTELLQWHGEGARRARAAGLHGMTSLWGAKIDSSKAKHLTSVARYAERLSDAVSVITDGSEETSALPLKEFSLKDPLRITSPVGPYLDEIVYEALAPLEEQDGSDELQQAACAAVEEMIRGAGAENISANLVRLPESLFASLDVGVMEAKKILQCLAKRDAPKRPKYWFGLCRAICLGGERLNYGSQNSVWDTSFRTKSCAIRLASIAVDCSFKSCSCRDVLDASKRNKHNCAFGFMRKVFELAKQVCRGDSFDFEACKEACELMQKVVSRIGSNWPRVSGSESMMLEFKEMWSSCVPVLHKLLVDSVPYEVVNVAAMAISEELVLSLQTQSVILVASSVASTDAVFSFLDSGMTPDLRKRFLYTDQGEDISACAVLALLSKHARVISALRISTEGAAKVLKARMEGSASVERLMYPVCGDFVSTLRSNGLRVLAKDGGALTSAFLEESRLQTIMSLYVAPIVLGAVSCSGLMEHGDHAMHCWGWQNEESAGVRMSSYCAEDELVVIAAMVWLLKHDRGDPSSHADWDAFWTQCHQTLEGLLCSDLGKNPLVREAIISFAQWNATEFLKLAERLSSRRALPLSSFGFVFDLVVSVVLLASQNDFTSFREAETRSIGRALRSLQSIIKQIATISATEADCYAAKGIDALWDVLNAEHAVVANTFAVADVQSLLCTFVSTCLSESSRFREVGAKASLSKVKAMFCHGMCEQSAAYVKVSFVMCRALSYSAVEDFKSMLLEMALHPPPKGWKTRWDRTSLGLCLECDGMEDLLVDLIASSGSRSPRENIRVLSLLQNVGYMALSQEDFFVPVALRISIAAILVEGEQGAIINKIGMIVYTTLISKLICSLSAYTGVPPGSYPDSIQECGTYLADLVSEDAESLGSFISSLREDEREAATSFLSQWEDHTSQANLITKVT